MSALGNRFRNQRARPRRRAASFGAGLEPLESRLCLSVIPVGSPILLDPQSLAQQLGTANVSIASDANGDFVASWDENPNSFSTTVAVQRFNAQGQPVGGEIQVANFTGAVGPQEQSSVAMDSAGDFTVVWNGFDSAGDASGIFMRQFSANGTPLNDGPVLLSPTPVSGRFTGDPQIAMDPAGDFVVAWTQPHADVDESEGIVAELFTPQGAPTGKVDGPFEANTFMIGNQYKPGVAMDANGNFIIAWLSDGQSLSGGTGVYVQRYKNTGATIGSEFEAYKQVEGGQVDHPSVAFAPDGGFIIASDSQTPGVFTVGRFNSSGKAAGPAQVITNDGTNAGTAVGFEPSGEALFVSSSDGVITGQSITTTGQLDGSPFTIYQAPTGFASSAFNPDITALPGDKFLVAFEGDVVTNVGVGVGAQEIISATPEPDIALMGNGVAIPAGESDPAVADATDFGTTVAMSGTTTQTFTIENNGDSDLHLTGDSPVQITGADAGDFSVLTQPAATVAPGGTTTFTVQFAPSALGDRTAAISVASDDPNQPLFTFDVQGAGLLSQDQPALVVTLAPDAIPATLVPGQKIKVSFVLTNLGSLAQGTVQLAFNFGPGDTLDPAVDVSLPGFSKSINLAPGKFVTLTESFTIPGTIPPGSVRLFIVPDAANTLIEANHGDDTTASVPSNLVWQFGNVDGKKSVKLVLPSPTGALTTFSLSGNGTSQVIPGDGGVWDLMLTGTDTHSSVTITTPSGKTTTIRNITDSADLKSFVAKTIDVSGNVTFSGVVSTLTLADATVGGQEIQIGDDAALSATPVTLTFGRASELSVDSLSPIKALTAIEWLDPSATRDTITAPSLGTLKITGNKKLGSVGDFDADVLLSDASPKMTLTSATIAGTLSGSVVRAAGNIGTITVGRLDDATILAGFTITPDGLPSQLSDFGAFTLGTLTVKGETSQPISVIDSIIAAATISTVTLKDVQLDNGGTPLGVAAETIKSYTRLVSGGQSVKLKSLKTQTANAEPGDTGDFVVRIV